MALFFCKAVHYVVSHFKKMSTPSENVPITSQKLPTEIIGIICRFSDFTTHITIRSTCSSIRHYVPQRKVVGFEEYRKRCSLYKIFPWRNNEKFCRDFQERIHLNINHDALSMDHLKFLDNPKK